MHGDKDIRYNSPKYYKSTDEDEHISYRHKNRVCKVTKGEHNFKLVSDNIYPFSKFTWHSQEWRCACGKKKIVFVDNKK